MISVEADALVRGLKLVKRATGSNRNLPILATVLVTTEPEKLFLTATDLEVVISYEMPAVVSEPSKAECLPIGPFIEALRGYQGEVVLEPGGRLSNGNRRTTLGALDADDFPPPPVVPAGAPKALFNSAELAGLLLAVLPAVDAGKAGRPILAGLHLELADGMAQFAATNGQSLHYGKIPAFMPDGDRYDSVVLPARACKILASAITGQTRARFMANAVEFRSKNVMLVTRTVEGSYPNYMQVIPEKSSTAIVVDQAELVRELGALRVSCKTNTKSLRISTTDIGAHLEALGDRLESVAEAYVPGTCRGDQLRISYNVELLLISLKALRGDLTMEFNTPVSPGLFRGNEGPDVGAVVMPLRLPTA